MLQNEAMKKPEYFRDVFSWELVGSEEWLGAPSTEQNSVSCQLLEYHTNQLTHTPACYQFVQAEISHLI